MSKPRAPAPPDPTKTAQAQTDQSLTTAMANNVMGMMGQKGPDGSLSYKQTGMQTINIGGKSYEIPMYEATTELSANGQQLYDTNAGTLQNLANAGNTLSGQIANTAGNPISYDDLPELAGSGGYQDRIKEVEDAMYARLNPQMQRARASLETTLANRGIRPGSEAYDRAMRNAGETENDARMQVTLGSGQEQSRLAGLDSATRAQLLQERYSQANEPISRLMAMLSGTKPDTPNFQTYQPQTMATTDIAGLTQQGFQNQQQNYQQQMQQQNAMVGGLFGLGSSALMGGFNPFDALGGLGKSMAKSDRNLKKDITAIGSLGGHNIYTFRYKTEAENEPLHVGVMAQEVERTRPDAVIDMADGKTVDYGKLGLEPLISMRVAI